MSELVTNALHAELRALIASSDTIKAMIMKVRKGLVFPVVSLRDVGHMPAKGEDEQEAARVFYVAATRATQRLVIGVDVVGVWYEAGVIGLNFLQSRRPDQWPHSLIPEQNWERGCAELGIDNAINMQIEQPKKD